MVLSVVNAMLSFFIRIAVISLGLKLRFFAIASV